MAELEPYDPEGNDKRSRILRAAAQEFVISGLQSPMSQIAKRADIAIGSVYLYFRSKQDLIRAVYCGVADQMTRDIIRTPPEDEPHDVRVKTYISDYIDFILADRERARLFGYLDNNPLMKAVEFAPEFETFINYSINLLDDAKSAGVVADRPSAMMASFVRGAIRNTLKRHLDIHEVLGPEDRLALEDMCWQAIARRAG
ncbi:TetR/AcrR family transcriptional regulator [Paracoccus sp. SCSIO 75233]|uniref:TetR/AcrR family transcriptional regulator n=1 Tax=Paracoccus sp. SCSIO 75233 TaxID=3017782 RepID=UPI0022F0BD62|nr:TetR/AcrR family transcriptional regulator [Paracoccus sp. SCSIO 75233]WBU53760.1 TetR/AcrR family transcriptional regulator [Paracoccus sp. SCSIO 75233]